ncbi:MAG: PEP-CTERM sorting domain-containing protein [Kiritimatiellae bacterium]|nr:PEP-CTERM sorting domain-containing protein [Kiritimatiellia bacterium]
MKKLIIAAAAIAMSAIANAATVSWSTDADVIYKSNGSGDEASGYAVYFLMGVDYAYASAVADIASGNYDFVSNAREGTEGTVVYSQSDGYAENYKVGMNNEYAQPLTTQAYLVVFDAADIANAKNVYISDAASVTITDVGAVDPINFDMGATASESAWTATAAPEPTSGLLLLLGMAGLALRRRHA